MMANSGRIGRVILARAEYVVEWMDKSRDVRREPDLYEPTEAQRTVAKQALIERAKQNLEEATAEWQKLQE